MRALLLIAAKEFARAWHGGGLWPPIAFFLMVAILFPFGIGPDPRLLARVGGAVAWVAALLAALLPVERLIEPDRNAGVLDQYQVRGISGELIGLAKTLGHWAGFAPTLILAAIISSALFQMSGDATLRLIAALAIGTPALAALGVAASALTAGLRGAAAIAGLLILPLCVPILIFGAAATRPFSAMGALKLLAASSIILFIVGVFAAGAALRALRS